MAFSLKTGTIRAKCAGAPFSENWVITDRVNAVSPVLWHALWFVLFLAFVLYKSKGRRSNWAHISKILAYSRVQFSRDTTATLPSLIMPRGSDLFILCTPLAVSLSSHALSTLVSMHIHSGCVSPSCLLQSQGCLRHHMGFRVNPQWKWVIWSLSHFLLDRPETTTVKTVNTQPHLPSLLFPINLNYI